MAYFMAFLLAAVVSIEAQRFDNPILTDRPNYYPSVIKVNGTYYITAQIYDTSLGLFFVHSSTDLKKWKPEVFLLDDTNTPDWGREGSFTSPSIHQIGSNFILYFTAQNASGPYYCIGVAHASHPLGPYITADEPILSLPRNQTYHPTVINDQGKLYLIWSTQGYSINARELSPDGLSFASDQVTKLLEPTVSWEERFIYYPWYIKRGNYHYIVYRGDCSYLGVARSTEALGPYEKLSYPILQPSVYHCLKDATIVKDLDDENDVIIYNYEKLSSWFVNIDSLSWDDEGWPSVGDSQD